MRYGDFKKKLQKYMEKKLKETGLSVQLNSIIKVNDHEREFITISGDDDRCSPILYLDSLYELHKCGMSMDGIAEYMLEIYTESEKRRDCPTALGDITVFKHVRDYITFRLVNTTANRRYLENAVYDEFLDLARVYLITLPESDDNYTASCKITPEYLDYWKINMTELRKLADINTRKIFGVFIREIRDVLRDMENIYGTGKPAIEDELTVHENDSDKIYVMSNDVHFSGAGVMLLQDILKDFAEEKKEDFYIVPSSIHEVLLVPLSDDCDPDKINGMISEVNKNLVPADEQLSDHVYIYKRENGRITM